MWDNYFIENIFFVPLFAVKRARGQAVLVLHMSTDKPKSESVCVLKELWNEDSSQKPGEGTKAS